MSTSPTRSSKTQQINFRAADRQADLLRRAAAETDSTTSAAPGDTLVTSLDAKVQGVVEKQLAEMIRLARLETDKVTGRKFAAFAGAQTRSSMANDGSPKPSPQAHQE